MLRAAAVAAALTVEMVVAVLELSDLAILVEAPLLPLSALVVAVALVRLAAALLPIMVATVGLE